MKLIGRPTYKKTTLLGHKVIEYVPHRRTLLVPYPMGRQHVVFPYLFFTFGVYLGKDRILAMLFSNKPASELTKNDCIYSPLVSNIEYGNCGICLGRSVQRISLEKAVDAVWQSEWSHGALMGKNCDSRWPKGTRRWRNTTLKTVIKMPWGKFDRYSEGEDTSLKLSELDYHLSFGCQ